MSTGQPDASPGPPNNVLNEILTVYLAQLTRENNALLRDSAAAEQLRRQVATVVEDVLSQLKTGSTLSMQPAGEARFLTVEIGTSRAQRGMHPIESLRASTVLFDIALPIIAERYAITAAPELLRLSRLLYQAIMERVGLASMAHVKFLTDKLRASRQEERRRIARELHDRVSHSMALALQHIDLHRQQAKPLPGAAKQEIEAAMSAVREALRTIQELSAELRRSVGVHGVPQAMRAYLDVNVPASVRASLTVSGDPKSLSLDASEELYLILREAAHNAIRHAEPSRLDVAIEIGNDEVRAAVTDDGHGFRTSETAPRGGLASMAERADLLRGVLRVRSDIGSGTTVSIRAPIGEGL